MEKNLLKDMKFFMSGPIDRVSDDGVKWRRMLKSKCKKEGLKIKFLDPTDKPKGIGSEIGDEKIRIKKLMSQKKWEQAQNEVKRFRRYDLRMVDMCHCFIIYININVHMCGSYDELNTAERQNKPIFVIMADGQSKYEIPTWLVASINEGEVFENIDDLVEHLKLLDNGKITFDRRWVKI